MSQQTTTEHPASVLAGYLGQIDKHLTEGLKRQSELTTILSGYLTEDELAKELGKSRKTIRRWKSLGEGPPRTMLGRDIRYARRDVEAWLKSQRVEAA